MDVVHAEMGRGWVWGSGRGVVTVRFETAETGPGPVRSFKIDDPALHPWRPSRRRPTAGLQCRTCTNDIADIAPRSGSFTARVVAYAALRELIPVFPVVRPAASPTPASPRARSRRCWSSGRRPTSCSRCRREPGPTPCRAAACSCWRPRSTPGASRCGRPSRRTPRSPAVRPLGPSGSLVSGTYEAYVYDHLTPSSARTPTARSSPRVRRAPSCSTCSPPPRRRRSSRCGA